MRARAGKGVPLLVLIVGVIAASVIYAAMQFRTDPFTELVVRGQPANVLFVFAKGRDLHHLQLLLFDPKTRRAGAFHVPSNLGLQLPELGRFDSISALFAQGGAEALRRRLEQLAKVRIPFHVVLSFERLAGLVDLLGGVELFISNPVDAEGEDARVLLPSGSLRLDGDKVVQYLSYQDPLEEEMERVGRRQKLLQALLKAMGEPASQQLLARPKPRAVLRGLLETNLSARGLDTLLRELARMDADHLVFQRVTGTERKVEGVVGDVLLPHYEGALVRETLAQMMQTLGNEQPLESEPLVVTVEILNGTSLDGLARRTRALYESFGFEVVSFGNADNDKYLNTVVLDRKGDPQAAQRVAELIRCARVHSEPNPASQAAVTVILGRDFDGRYVKR